MQAAEQSPEIDALALEERPRSLSDIVFETVHQAIVNRVLEPGEPVTEPGLAERLKVSKTPVREALLRLRQVGLIEPDGGRGLRVTRLSPEGLRQTYEIREALESFTAARAAEIATPDDREQILAAAHASHAAAVAEDVESFKAANRELHRLIASVSGNPRMAQLIADAESLIGTLIHGRIPGGEGLNASSEAHLRIAYAIGAGDAGLAQREMSEHIRLIKELTLVRLSSNEDLRIR